MISRELLALRGKRDMYLHMHTESCRGEDSPSARDNLRQTSLKLIEICDFLEDLEKQEDNLNPLKGGEKYGKKQNEDRG